ALLGLLERRLRLREVGLRAFERRLVRPVVELVEQGARLDHAALGEGDLLDVALDAHADLDVVRRVRLADELVVDRNVGLRDLNDVDGRRLGRRGRLLRAASEREDGAAGRDRDGRPRRRNVEYLTVTYAHGLSNLDSVSATWIARLGGCGQADGVACA